MIELMYFLREVFPLCKFFDIFENSLLGNRLVNFLSGIFESWRVN